jgi:chemotaxis protein MotB
MARAKKCPPAGAPEWVLTYGDMMSLLLVFFIMLVALSEIKKEDEYNAIVEEVQKAFGIKGGGGKLPTKDDPELSLIERLVAISLHQQKEPNHSNTVDPGMEGRESTVTKVREGLRYAIGGRITFEPGSADLTEYGRQQLRDVVEEFQIRGTNNIIEIRGHAASMELAENPRFSDLWQLSYARAKAVMDYQTGDEVGLKPDRFRLIANADREPLARRAYSTTDQEPNRRAEVIVTDSLVQQFTQPESTPGS